MTKGLEFDAVILVNASRKHYPISDVDNRLLYLAITRAAHYLHINWYGKIAEILAIPGFYRKPKAARKNVKKKE